MSKINDRLTNIQTERAAKENTAFKLRHEIMADLTAFCNLHPRFSVLNDRILVFDGKGVGMRIFILRLVIKDGNLIIKKVWDAETNHTGYLVSNSYLAFQRIARIIDEFLLNKGLIL